MRTQGLLSAEQLLESAFFTVTGATGEFVGQSSQDVSSDFPCIEGISCEDHLTSPGLDVVIHNGNGLIMNNHFVTLHKELKAIEIKAR
uniref:Uncharacterized protein n=1 Tax=Bracon brevicornis TaxID=1563983 RepID=A0A6V7JIX3_9HYME